MHSKNEYNLPVISAAREQTTLFHLSWKQLHSTRVPPPMVQGGEKPCKPHIIVSICYLLGREALLYLVLRVITWEGVIIPFKK